MNSWPLQDGKARFREFLDAAINKGPQMVTRRGVETSASSRAGTFNPFHCGRRIGLLVRPWRRWKGQVRRAVLLQRD